MSYPAAPAVRSPAAPATGARLIAWARDPETRTNLQVLGRVALHQFFTSALSFGPRTLVNGMIFHQMAGDADPDKNPWANQLALAARLLSGVVVAGAHQTMEWVQRHVEHSHDCKEFVAGGNVKLVHDVSRNLIFIGVFAASNAMDDPSDFPLWVWCKSGMAGAVAAGLGVAAGRVMHWTRLEKVEPEKVGPRDLAFKLLGGLGLGIADHFYTGGSLQPVAPRGVDAAGYSAAGSVARLTGWFMPRWLNDWAAARAATAGAGPRPSPAGLHDGAATRAGLHGDEAVPVASAALAGCVPPAVSRAPATAVAGQVRAEEDVHAGIASPRRRKPGPAERGARRAEVVQGTGSTQGGSQVPHRAPPPRPPHASFTPGRLQLFQSAFVDYFSRNPGAAQGVPGPVAAEFNRSSLQPVNPAVNKGVNQAGDAGVGAPRSREGTAQAPLEPVAGSAESDAVTPLTPRSSREERSVATGPGLHKVLRNLATAYRSPDSAAVAMEEGAVPPHGVASAGLAVDQPSRDGDTARRDSVLMSPGGPRRPRADRQDAAAAHRAQYRAT